MAAVPRKLADWTLEALRQLVQAGAYETRAFDFKEALPPSSDSKGKARLRTSLAAFANSGGGFLVFGVVDDRAREWEARIIGVDPTIDVPEHLGAQNSACVPRVDWTFKNEPPLRLGSGRVVHVVEVLEGRNKPHGIVEDGRWIFPKRTDAGNEHMSYEELRDAFRDRAAARRSVLAIGAEADRMLKQAEEVTREAWRGDYNAYLRFRFRPSILDSAVMSVVDLGYIELLEPLNELRAAAAACDDESARILTMRENGPQEALANLARIVQNSARGVRAAVDRILSPVA